MAEFERPVKVHVLPYGSKSPRDFEEREALLDPMRHTAGSVIDKLNVVRGILVHEAKIIDDAALVKNWHTSTTAPIVVVECAPDFEETDEWARNTNYVARLLNARLSTECALAALGRSYWQTGFKEFFASASILRSLVDNSGSYDYQRRSEVACMDSLRHLQPVMVYNENTAEIMRPPILRGDVTGGPILDEWVDAPRPHVSAEEQTQIDADASAIELVMPPLNELGAAVVRVFGYHPTRSSADGELSMHRQAVHPFTGFFVSPQYILTTRTAAFSVERGTFAMSFKFTRNTRCLHGMLRDGVDLLDLRVVDGITDYLADKIRHIGVVVEENKVPDGLYACPWNDFLLLEVVDRSNYSPTYLLPELDSDTLHRQEQVFSILYANRPSASWMNEVFGDMGYNCPIEEEELRRQWWGYDIKCCSVGETIEDKSAAQPSFKHSCSALPGSRGSPVFRSFFTSRGIPTYCGINCGRATEVLQKEREHIVEMSSGEAARKDSLAYSMHNEAISSTHLCLVLLYQEFIAKKIEVPEHRQHMRQYLAPYDIFVSRDLLSNCHRKMLEDANDHNEYGMDFYEHHDLTHALACFREGAKMFSTASIPNLTDFELELKNALQTNVAAVVVAKLNLGEEQQQLQ